MLAQASWLRLAREVRPSWPSGPSLLRGGRVCGSGARVWRSARHEAWPAPAPPPGTLRSPIRAAAAAPSPTRHAI